MYLFTGMTYNHNNICCEHWQSAETEQPSYERKAWRSNQIQNLPEASSSFFVDAKNIYRIYATIAVCWV